MELERRILMSHSAEVASPLTVLCACFCMASVRGSGEGREGRKWLWAASLFRAPTMSDLDMRRKA